MKQWKPERSASKGAIAYHEAVSRAGHYISILDDLMKMVLPKIKDNDVVVDFGAGTGVSALRLIEHMKSNAQVWLVDNSPAWLGKAYEELGSKKNVKCFLLEKSNGGYLGLSEAIGEDAADHVISANTIHLVPNPKEVFIGIAKALKGGGNFIFQSGNITRSERPHGALMVDDSVRRVHDIALDIVRTDPKFAGYKKDIDERIKSSEMQRKFVFPDPKPIEFYLDALKNSGFGYQEPYFKLFKVRYDEWLDFLRVRRLQAGILPEIGGYDPTPQEETDRDTLITMATKNLFKQLMEKNELADKEGFTIEVVYVSAKKGTKEKLLKGKIALITGASRGIGRAIAIELAKNGADVIINYNKSKEEANEVLEQIGQESKGIALKADVSDLESVDAMFKNIVKQFSGNIDILVNNAGIVIDKTLNNMDPLEWNTVMDVNLNSLFNVTKNALPLMRDNGRIINISSIVGLNGNFGQSNYAASKAGIIGFTKSLAKELGKRGITVNAIAPGMIETDILKSIPAEKKQKMSDSIPIGRPGRPNEIANVVVFLASEKSSYVTGEIIRVDGGLTF